MNNNTEHSLNFTDMTVRDAYRAPICKSYIVSTASAILNLSNEVMTLSEGADWDDE